LIKIIFKITFLLFLFIGAFYAGLKPIYNWDMIGYMGSVLKINTPNPKKFHNETYNILRHELEPENYSLLSSGYYRSTMESDFRAFNENLPYYTNRITYIGLIYAFFKLGIPLTFSTVLPSLISIILITIILYVVLRRELKDIFLASSISIMILFLPQTIYLARLSTPDALSVFILILITITYLYKFNWIIIFLLMLLSIMTRTENIIWCELLLILEMISPSKRKNSLYIILGGVSLILLYFILIQNNGGWKILFYNSFVERHAFPLSHTPTLSFKDYVITMVKKTPDYLPWFLLVAISFYKLIRVSLKDLIIIPGGKIIIISVVTFFVKFSLFPSFDSRFYFGIVLILFITFVVEYKKLLFEYNKSR
jgi:hypothetical protein